MVGNEKSPSIQANRVISESLSAENYLILEKRIIPTQAKVKRVRQRMTMKLAMSRPILLKILRRGPTI